MANGAEYPLGSAVRRCGGYLMIRPNAPPTYRDTATVELCYLMWKGEPGVNSGVVDPIKLDVVRSVEHETERYVLMDEIHTRLGTLT